jgi:predicted nucleic acid-binding protein
VTEGRAEVVCDAGPLIHLDELGCLALLCDFPLVLVPEDVWREVERHRPSALDQETVILQARPVSILATPAFEALARALALDRGEQAALSLSMGRPGSLFLTDDSAARLAARALGVRAQGTIGVLVRSIRRQQRTREQVVDMLRDLPALSTLHIRPSLLAEIIREVERG